MSSEVSSVEASFDNIVQSSVTTREQVHSKFIDNRFSIAFTCLTHTETKALSNSDAGTKILMQAALCDRENAELRDLGQLFVSCDKKEKLGSTYDKCLINYLSDPEETLLMMNNVKNSAEKSIVLSAEAH
ncbi:Hypothetical predicted protein [Octopus vulgaris]|uniref:Uncharacterized protein n=1 Tax=Octopus vulgaris TaxID=6645 RepID=A0AA36FN17_OCTVU|nr:Hypothetical predicted protein [Octopus vulgaris]